MATPDESTPTPARRLPAPDLASLPRERLEDMHDAAALALRCEAALRASGMSVVTEMLRGGADQFVVWDRYPADGIHDGATHSQYFYHAHDAAEMADGEHGHFHLFLRGEAFPQPPAPWPSVGARVGWSPNESFVHLAAISVDANGRPLRVFTTNRWVTDETMARCEDVIAVLDRFVIGAAFPNLAVSDWLNAMARLYRPQIEGLLRLRDAAILDFLAAHPDGAGLEDRRLQNVSEIDIDIPAQIAAIEAALGIEG